MVNHTNDHYSLLYNEVHCCTFDSTIDQEYDYYNMNEMFSSSIGYQHFLR